jgi:hypothetical protein
MFMQISLEEIIKLNNHLLKCSFIKGFIHRLEPECDENKHFIQYTKYNYLMKLKNALPKNVLNKTWPSAPQLLQKVTFDGNYPYFI